MTADDFLDTDALHILTGCRQKKRQIAQLRKMGLVFWVNASGHPVVPRSAIEGKKEAAAPEKTWEPRWAA